MPRRHSSTYEVGAFLITFSQLGDDPKFCVMKINNNQGGCYQVEMSTKDAKFLGNMIVEFAGALGA